MLMADGFRIVVLADFAIEPAACVLAARFAGERQSPFPEAFFKEGLLQSRQIADLADAAVIEVALRHFAHAGDLAYVERSQEARLAAGEDPQNAVGLGLIRRNLGDQA